MSARRLRPLTRRPLHWRLAGVSAAVLLLVVLWFSPALGLLPPLALYNTTPSVAPGLYLYARSAKAPLARGDYLAVRNPPHFDLFWLLKRAAGLPGDRYCWDGAAGTHELNGAPMPPPDPGSVAMGIPVWKGCETLAPDEVVLYGRTPDSYDSRYLGPVRTRDLWGVYRPVWVGP